MADGWQMLGDALGGNSEESYQKGLAMGANTQNALAQARARVDENKAKQELATVLESILPPDMAAAAATSLRAGGNLADPFTARNKNQEFDLRGRASDPNLTFSDRNIALQGLAPSPVDRYQKVGGGADDRFNEEGIVPLGDALGGEAGGMSAAMQLVNRIESDEQRVRGDPNFRLSPQQVLGIARETQRVTDAGGVPNIVDLSASLGLSGGRGGAAPAAPAAPGTAPAAAPAGGTSMTPLTTAQQVGSNAGEIERAKVVGKGVGEAQLSLPQAQARFNNQTAQMDLVMGDIDELLPEVSGWTAGPGGKFLANIWGTPAYDLASAVDVIKSNIGFQQLQQMRYESPTGGALGQVAVQELQFLQAALGNLQQAQSPAQLRRMLSQVRGRYENFKKAASADYAAAQQMARGNVAGATGAAVAPAQETKVINGKTYRKVGPNPADWVEDDGQ